MPAVGYIYLELGNPPNKTRVSCTYQRTLWTVTVTQNLGTSGTPVRGQEKLMLRVVS